MCVFSVSNVFEGRRPSALPFSEGWVGPAGGEGGVELSIELGHGSSFN